VSDFVRCQVLRRTIAAQTSGIPPENPLKANVVLHMDDRRQHACVTQIDNAGRGPIVSSCFAGFPMTQEEISGFCVDSLAKVLRIAKDRIKTDTKFNRLGLDSAMVVYVMMELEEKLDLELSTDDFYDHPTVDALSRYLADRLAARSAA
jgi:acyl carrier protein